jgi:hypothetical protein
MPNQIFYYNENCISGGQLCFDEDQIEAYRNGEGCDISAFNDENDSVEETLKWAHRVLEMTTPTLASNWFRHRTALNVIEYLENN